MATRSGTGVWVAKGVHKWNVTGLLNGDDSTYLDAPNLPDKTVSVTGTQGVGGAILIEDGSGFVLNDPNGNPLSGVTMFGKTESILENPGKLRARVTAGDGATSMNVEIISTSTRR